MKVLRLKILFPIYDNSLSHNNWHFKIGQVIIESNYESIDSIHYLICQTRHLYHTISKEKPDDDHEVKQSHS